VLLLRYQEAKRTPTPAPAIVWIFPPAVLDRLIAERGPPYAEWLSGEPSGKAARRS
jgi:hypothetical protein